MAEMSIIIMATTEQAKEELSLNGRASQASVFQTEQAGQTPASGSKIAFTNLDELLDAIEIGDVEYGAAMIAMNYYQLELLSDIKKLLTPVPKKRKVKDKCTKSSKAKK